MVPVPYMIGYIKQYISINPDKSYAFTRNGKNLRIGTLLYRFLLTKQAIHMVLYRNGSLAPSYHLKSFNNLNTVFD